MRLRFVIAPAIFYLILIPKEAFSVEREVELEPIIITQEEFEQETDIPTKNISTVGMRQKLSAFMEEILDYQRGKDMA